jgi:hypothetical protein
MILLKLLKLFGIDVPGRIARLQARFEQRVEVARDQVRQAAQIAAVVAALSAIAGVAVLAAAGVGLVALYRWVVLSYGQFYGLAAVGGVLILIAIILITGAILEARSWSTAEGTAGQQPKPAAAEARSRADHVTRPAAAAELEQPAPVLLPPPARTPTSAADLVAPLSLILARVMKLPTTGNPVLDELLFALRGPVEGIADDAVDGVVRTVRYGARTKLVAVLGTAVLVGWLLARHRPDQVKPLQAGIAD